MIRGSNSALNIFSRALDLIILIAFTLAAGGWLIPHELSKVLAIYCAFLMIVVFSLFHLYQTWQMTKIMHQLRTLAMAWCTVLVLFNLIIILLSSKEQLTLLTPFGLFSSAGFDFWAMLVFSGLAAGRTAVDWVLKTARSRGYNQQVAVIIGAGDTGRKLAQYLYENQWLGIRIAGFFDDMFAPETPVSAGSQTMGKVLGSTDEYHDFSMRNGIDLVFLALPMSAEKKISEIVGKLGTSGHTVLMVQDLFSFGIQKAQTQHLGELQVLDFYLFPTWKRIFDIVFSLLVVLITLPLWFIVMVAIKIEDGGPIFFRHLRVMEGGKRFACLKFRSMHIDAHERLDQILAQNPLLEQEWREHYKLKDDPRVTNVGKILRRFRLDELPQFLNVLSGEMSVVGARPVVSEELDKYYRQISLTYCAMKPGITGLWQVSPQSSIMNYTDRVELDRRYILNCTIWMDITIILKTFFRIIRAESA